jgi:hypothetical protein
MNKQSTFKTMPIAARFTIVLFAVLGVAAVVYTVAFQNAFDPIRLTLLLAGAATCARVNVNLFKGTTLSLLTSVVLLAVIQDGLAAAMLVGIFGVTVQNVRPGKKIVLHQLAFNGGMISLTVAATWWTYQGLASASSAAPLSATLTATVLGSFVYFLGNSLSVSLIIAVTKRMSMVDVWMNHFMQSAPSFLIAGLLALGVVGMLNRPSMVLAFIPVIVVSISYWSSVRVMAASKVTS